MIYNSSNPFECEKAKIYFEKLLKSGKSFELTEKKKRTNDQNSLLHLWITVIADEFGILEKEDLKRDLKRILLGQKEEANTITGEVQYIDYETSKMSTTELSDFMNKLKIWAQNEHSIYLPYYRDAGYNEMYEQFKNR